MCDGYLLSDTQLPYYIIGNYNTKYGSFLKKKYENTNIHFLGAIFNKEELDTFRFFASYYLHGHSVGGTNPALIEAMAAQAFVIVHDNPFNKSVNPHLEAALGLKSLFQFLQKLQPDTHRNMEQMDL